MASSYSTLQRVRRAERLPAYSSQRDYIAQSARKLYELQGVKKTTLADIAREANITRELIYYYFGSKDEITQCVINDYIEDAVDTADLWCQSIVQADGRHMSLEQLVASAVAAIRRFVFYKDGSRRPMVAVLRELDIEAEVITRISNRVYSKLNTYSECDYIAELSLHFGVEHLSELFKFILLGVVGLMLSDRNTDDNHIAQILLQGMMYSIMPVHTV